MEGNGNDSPGKIDFDRYIDDLANEEKRRLNQAIENYKEWEKHFNLLHKNFSETEKVFRKIQDKVPMWEVEGIEKRVALSEIKYIDFIGLNHEGYYFNFGICKVQKPADRMALYHGDALISLNVFYGNDDDGIGDERSISGHGFSDSKLQGARKIQRDKNITPENTASMLEKLDSCELEFELFRNDRDPLTKRSVGIGFLYDHNLAEVCKQLFVVVNNPDFTDDDIDAIVPPGEYKRPADDNNIWRNR